MFTSVYVIVCLRGTAEKKVGMRTHGVPAGEPMRLNLHLFRLFLTVFILDLVVNVVLLAGDQVAWLIMADEVLHPKFLLYCMCYA